MHDWLCERSDDRAIARLGGPLVGRTMQGQSDGRTVVRSDGPTFGRTVERSEAWIFELSGERPNSRMDRRLKHQAFDESNGRTNGQSGRRSL